MTKLMQKVAAMKKAAFAQKLSAFMSANRGRDWMPKTASEKRNVLRGIMKKQLSK